MSDLHTIEHFRRLSYPVKLELAERFGLRRPEDGGGSDMTSQWLLRARESGKLDELGAAVQLAPQ